MKEYKDEEERSKWEEVRATIKLFMRHNRDGGGGTLEKAWLSNRVGSKEGTPYYGGGVYVYRYNIELYYLTPDHNGDKVPLIGKKMPGQT